VSGVDFALELEVLRALRSRVTEVRSCLLCKCVFVCVLAFYVYLYLVNPQVCMSEEYLTIYKKYMKQRLRPKVNNRLRDVEDELTQYSFAWYSELIFSYEVCGGCEAHAILTAMHHGVTAPRSDPSSRIMNTSTSAAKVSAVDAAVRAAGLLRDLSPTQRETNIGFKYCPAFD
jgi:hypothetical protein